MGLTVEEQKEMKNQEIKSLEANANIFRELNNIVRTEAWKKSGKKILEGFEKDIFEKILSEYENVNGKIFPISGKELKVRQKVYKEISNILKPFKDPEIILMNLLAQIDSKEEDLKKFNNEVLNESAE